MPRSNKAVVKKSLAGKRFGKLTVVAPIFLTKRNHYGWECKCDCGATVLASAYELRCGSTISCGCARRKPKPPRKPRVLKTDPPIKQPDSFWEKVDKTDGCWLWVAGKDSGGYGIYRKRPAHRVSYVLAYGSIPDGHIICHTCDHRGCVRPEHLYAGTDADNARDRNMCGKGARNFSGPVKKTTPLEKFWARVNKNPDGCWEWTASLSSNGYGRFSPTSCYRDRVLAHRFSYAQFVGAIPDGMIICHHCDNRKCVRPDHLFVGTNADNAKDRILKGR